MSSIKIKVPQKNAEAKLIEKIRTIQRSEKENKKCADCTQMGPTYVCSIEEHRVFVCTVCSGIHREMNNKVKGISVSKWTAEEIADIENGGNRRANEYFLARWDSGRDPPEPDAGQPQKVREFVKLKYRDRRWASRDQQSTGGARSTGFDRGSVGSGVTRAGGSGAGRGTASTNSVDLLDGDFGGSQPTQPPVRTSPEKKKRSSPPSKQSVDDDFNPNAGGSSAGADFGFGPTNSFDLLGGGGGQSSATSAGHNTTVDSLFDTGPAPSRPTANGSHGGPMGSGPLVDMFGSAPAGAQGGSTPPFGGGGTFPGTQQFPPQQTGFPPQQAGFSPGMQPQPQQQIFFQPQPGVPMTQQAAPNTDPFAALGGGPLTEQMMQNPYAQMPPFQSDLKALLGLQIPNLSPVQIQQLSPQECQTMSRIMDQQMQVLLKHIRSQQQQLASHVKNNPFLNQGGAVEGGNPVMGGAGVGGAGVDHHAGLLPVGTRSSVGGGAAVGGAGMSAFDGLGSMGGASSGNAGGFGGGGQMGGGGGKMGGGGGQMGGGQMNMMNMGGAGAMGGGGANPGSMGAGSMGTGGMMVGANAGNPFGGMGGGPQQLPPGETGVPRGNPFGGAPAPQPSSAASGNPFDLF